MQQQWLPIWNRIALLVGVLALLVGGVRAAAPLAQAQDGPLAPAQVQEPLTDTYPFYQNAAIALALPYLQSQQQEDGGLDAFGFGSNPGGTARVVYALNAVGYPTDAVQTAAGTTLIDFLQTQVISYTYANAVPADDNLFPGAAGLVLAAVAAADADPTSFGGVNLTQAITSTLKPTGAYSTTAAAGFSSGAANAINQSLAIFGLVAAGQPIPTAATDWLLGAQETDGSWFGGNTDITAYAIMALIGSGNVPATDPAIQRAVAFLRSQQTSGSALWGDGGSGEPANSTGWSMTALATAGYMPMTASWATGGTNPQQALLALQDAEGIIAQNFRNAYATLEAFYGLTAQPLYMARPARVARALAWMAEQQNADGGWPSFATESAAGETIDVVLAFAAAGYDPASVTTGGNSPLDYLAGVASSYTRDNDSTVFPARLGKLIVGVVATGGDPTSYGAENLNLVSDLQATLQATGAYSTTAAQGFATGAASSLNQSFAILGLAAAGETVPQAAIDWLIGQQTDGAWGSIDVTGLALQALRAAGVAPDDAAIVAGITYLRDNQSASGGWEAFGAYSTNSTAYAIQGLLAAGVDLTGSAWLKNGRSPLGVLGSYQKPDGPFAVNWNYAGISESFNPTADNLLATQQAVPTLLGAFYPYTTVPTTSLQLFTPIARGPDPDRLVAVAPAASFSTDQSSVAVTAPFGSDLNGNGSLVLEWRLAEGSFAPISTTRAVGFYSATLDLAGTGITPLDTLEFRATFSDADMVQNGTSSSQQEAVIGQLAPSSLYLPLLIGGSPTNAATQNDAGLAVRFSNGTVQTDCATLDGWTWGASGDTQAQPPARTFAEVCPGL